MSLVRKKKKVPKSFIFLCIFLLTIYSGKNISLYGCITMVLSKKFEFLKKQTKKDTLISQLLKRLMTVNYREILN